MSLEENKHNVELKDQYSVVLERYDVLNNLDQTVSDLEAETKLYLKESIDTLRANAQYETQATDEEKADIESWYIQATT